MTSQRPFLLLRISFPGRPIFIQLPPGREQRRQDRGPGDREAARHPRRQAPLGQLPPRHGAEE